MHWFEAVRFDRNMFDLVKPWLNKNEIHYDLINCAYFTERHNKCSTFISV